MNLQAVTASAVGAVNPPLVGSIRYSTGYGYVGDAHFTGSIAGSLLTVTAVASGSIAPNVSVFSSGARGKVLSQVSGTPGGAGVYNVAVSQTVASGRLSTVGAGTRVPIYSQVDNVSMQVQALAGRELQHLDSLNIQGVLRAIYIQGDVRGIVRADGTGGELILLPTGQVRGQALDEWLVATVLETWDTGGWCKVAVSLQNPPQDQ